MIEVHFIIIRSTPAAFLAAKIDLNYESCKLSHHIVDVHGLKNIELCYNIL